jgi:hypothetical protein
MATGLRWCTNPITDIYAESFLTINNFLGGDELREQAAALRGAFSTAKRNMLCGVAAVS